MVEKNLSVRVVCTLCVVDGNVRIVVSESYRNCWIQPPQSLTSPSCGEGVSKAVLLQYMCALTPTRGEEETSVAAQLVTLPLSEAI